MCSSISIGSSWSTTPWGTRLVIWPPGGRPSAEAAVDEPVLVARFGGDEFTVLVPKVEHVDQLVAVGVRLLTSIAEPYQVAATGWCWGPVRRAALAIEETSDPQSWCATQTPPCTTPKTWVVAAPRCSTIVSWRRGPNGFGGGQRYAPPSNATSSTCTSSPPSVFPMAWWSGPRRWRARPESANTYPRRSSFPWPRRLACSAVFEVVFSQVCRRSVEPRPDDPVRGVGQPLAATTGLGCRRRSDRSHHRCQRRLGIDASASRSPRAEFSLDPEEAAEFLTRLRLLGARVAFDDFGTGYSIIGLPADIAGRHGGFGSQLCHPGGR